MRRCLIYTREVGASTPFKSRLCTISWSWRMAPPSARASSGIKREDECHALYDQALDTLPARDANFSAISVSCAEARVGEQLTKSRVIAVPPSASCNI
mmetsp:Transcript_87687/g.253232  ORF Transcript_87687/g.253232 Transcript_87687/m.253232 type:complete len:98 (+) Transcript_87687:265-558(+)